MGVFNIFKQKDLPTAPTSNLSDSHIRYLEKMLKLWFDSPLRNEQLLAEKYYDGDHDILRRERKMVNAEGILVPVNNVPNNKLVDNQYRKLVDQKTNYTLGKPMTIATSQDEYVKLLNKIFTKKVHRKIRMLAQYAIDGGIAWLYPYYDESGNFNISVFPSYEVCPIWKDKSHTELESAIRVYPTEVFNANGSIDTEYKVEVYTTSGISHFKWRGGTLIPDETPHTTHMTYDGNGYDWDRLPIIPFKYNAKEIPLIRNVKSLQDALNQVLSDFQNNMEEDPRTSILVLKNYDGTNLGEFRQNLAALGVIKVTTVDGVQGDVDVLKVEVNAQNYQAILMQLKRAIVENGRGFDAKEERMDGDPNQMNIESMYTDIDLDVNAMETEFQAGFEELKWFIDKHLQHIGEADYSEEEVEFIFNRDIFINEDAKIDNCVKSVGIISNKTILSRHPWVTNIDHEQAQMEEDKEAELEEMDATMKIQAKNTPKPVKPANGGGSND